MIVSQSPEENIDVCVMIMCMKSTNTRLFYLYSAIMTSLYAAGWKYELKNHLKQKHYLNQQTQRLAIPIMLCLEPIMLHWQENLKTFQVGERTMHCDHNPWMHNSWKVPGKDLHYMKSVLKAHMESLKSLLK